MRNLRCMGAGALALVFLLGTAAIADEEPREVQSLGTKVLSKIHHTNEVEMEAGRLAQAKGHSEKVRSYGDRLFRDHKTADEKVQALAEDEGIELVKVKPDTPEAKKHQKKVKETMEKLRAVEGEEFDRVFLKFMVEGHEHSIDELRSALEKLEDPDVRELVADLIPILDQHLELAIELRQELVVDTDDE